MTGLLTKRRDALVIAVMGDEVLRKAAACRGGGCRHAPRGSSCGKRLVGIHGYHYAFVPDDLAEAIDMQCVDSNGAGLRMPGAADGYVR